MEEVYVIFICDGDVMKCGRPMYHFTMKDEMGTELEDGRHVLFLNANYPGDWKLKDLMDDLKSADPEQMRYDVLKKRTEYFKNKEEGRMRVCEGMMDWYNTRNQKEREQWEKKLKLQKEEADEKLKLQKEEADEKLKLQKKEAGEQFAKKMLAGGEPIEKIMEYSSLSGEEIERIRKKMA